MLRKLTIKIEDGKAIVNGLVIEIENINLIKAFKPGANGIVFQAHEYPLDRPVAVKVWIPKKGDYRDKDKQALAEAKKIAKLNHPNIVKIFRIGQLDNGLFYTVMELLPGETLKSILKNKMQLMPRLKLWHDIYDALIFAHSKQIYHGDLHDGNIVVHEERAKLIDFGTSIFARKKLKNPLERESKKILEIVKRIFPEFDMLSVNEIINSNIKPEIILQIADIIVEINCSLLQLSRAIEANDHHRIWGELHSICIHIDTTDDIHNYLFIKPEYIIKSLRDIHIDEDYVGYFLDIYLAFITDKVEGKGRRSVEPDSVTPIENKLIHINKILQNIKMTI